MVMKKKIKWEISSNNEMVQYATRIFSNNTTICPISFIQNCGLQLYIGELFMWATREPFHNTYLVIKASIWKAFIMILWRANQSDPLLSNWTSRCAHN